MVILVDDEDDVEEERQHVPRDSGSASRLGSNYSAEALPWDEKRHQANPSGVSTSIWSDSAEPQGLDAIGRPKPRTPMFRQPSEIEGSGQQPFVARPGPKIAGRAFSVTLNNGRRISADDESGTSYGGAESRPTSRDSAFVSMQKSMQPRVKIAGRPSLEGNGGRKAPIANVPAAYAERETGMDGKPFKRTYKSLSPYGMLFED